LISFVSCKFFLKMTSIGTLWGVPGSHKRVLAVAALAGVQIDLPEKYEHFVDNYKPEYTSKFPHAKIPAFEGKNGFLLFEGTAIARYVASLNPNVNILGSTPEEEALVDQWTSFSDTEIHAQTNLIGPLLRNAITPYSKSVHTALLDRAYRSFATLEKVLETRTFLVGERITLADITVTAVVQRGADYYLDATTRPKYPGLIRLVETVANHPALKEIFGPIVIPEKIAAYVPPAKEKKKDDKPKAEKAPKAEKPKKEEKPKEVEPEEEDDLVPEEPKAKNPLDFLPKSTFNLEDWKRAYSNMDTRGPGGSIEWFYEHFDKEGFSVWRCDFKYNEELTLVFMSSNQITGFFNRLEGSRKYLFASLGVLGTANNSVISGIIITRGDDIRLSIDVAPDWESYEYKKIDLADEEQKKFFEAALAWDLEIDGKAWADGKNFK